MRNGNRLTLIAAGLTGTLICVFVSQRFYGHPKIKLRDGTLVRDFSVAQIGSFAGPDFVGTRAVYLQNQKLYLQLKKLPLPCDPGQVSAEVTSKLISKFSTAHFAKAEFSRQPRNVIDRLQEHWSLALARCAGMPMNSYLSQLPVSLQLKRPSNIGVLDQAMKEFLGSKAETLVDRSTLNAAFEKLYLASLSDGERSSRITEIAVEGPGAVVAMDQVTVPGATDLLSQRLKEPLDSYFVGRMSQGQLLFHQMPDDLVQPDERVLQAEVIAIAFTAGGDCYPLVFVSRYNSIAHHWWLVKVCRESSPRMAVSVPLVF